MDPRAYLFSLEQLGIKLGLAQMQALMAALGHPDRAYRTIIVAGTNGKGSVTAMVERGLRAAGLRTGRYTSPHLVRLEERFAVDGRDVAPAVLDAAIARVREAAATLPHPPSFFEATTAAAFLMFKEAGVDIAVIEVGLGGRLDATNVVTPEMAVITSIDFDHESFLGSTLDAIAAEKAGVIKPGIRVVLADNPDVVRHVVGTACRERGAHLTYAPDGVRVVTSDDGGQTRLQVLETPAATYRDIRLALRGAHQVGNALVAVRVLEQVPAHGAPIPASAIATALADTVWPARLERLVVQGVPVLLDGAHNPAGARALASYVRHALPAAVPIVIGAMRDKQVRGIVAALAPIASRFVCTAPDTVRAATPAELAGVVAECAPHVPCTIAPSLGEAIARAGRDGNLVVVAGSLYLAGEVRAMAS